MHPAYQRPELATKAPNEVWSWELTKLRGPGKSLYFHLFVLVDLFSRFVVAWLLVRRESGRARPEAARGELRAPRHRTRPAHDPRGPWLGTGLEDGRPAPGRPRRGAHSRPHASNDNPFSESHFASIKDHPEFPDRFASFERAHDFCRLFFPWFNSEHRHSDIAWLTRPRQ